MKTADGTHLDFTFEFEFDLVTPGKEGNDGAAANNSPPTERELERTAVSQPCFLFTNKNRIYSTYSIFVLNHFFHITNFAVLPQITPYPLTSTFHISVNLVILSPFDSPAGIPYAREHFWHLVICSLRHLDRRAHACFSQFSMPEIPHAKNTEDWEIASSNPFLSASKTRAQVVLTLLYPLLLIHLELETFE